MNRRHASQVAELLNLRNQLAGHYDANRVLATAERYILKLLENSVAGFVEVRPVQWYQAEVLHLTVAEGHEGSGLGKWLLAAALARATAQGNRLAQCTIRANNQRSEGLFAGRGFGLVNRFLNAETGNVVGVWQKVLEPIPPQAT